VIAVAADFEVPWVAGAGIVGIAAGAAAGTRVADKILTDVVDPVRAAVAARAAVDERLALVIHGGAGLSPLRDVDPYSIGVWRSAAAEEQRDKAVTRPPYVPRSIDGALADRLATIGPEGGVVVVSGHPKAGKSRTLFEALARSPVTQDRTLYALRTPNTTAGAATTRPFDALIDTRTDIDGPTSVLWMDDAHEHFSYGLTLARLTKLRERHERLIVAMTIHTERLQPPPRRAEADELSPVDLALLDHLAQLAHDLATTLSAQEQGVARDAYPGLLDHIESPVDFERLPSWFAGVDYLRDRYHRAGPVHYGGKAVARAINWRRAGKPAGINDTQLRQLADIALDELDPGAAYTDDTYAAALDWARGVDKASDPGWHGIALVRPVPGSNQSLWRDFDAVTAWVTDGPRPDPPLSHRTWTAVLDHVTPDTAFPVGIAAYWAGEVDISITTHRIAVEAGDTDAMYSLGYLLANELDPPQVDDARTWYGRAAEAGNTNAMHNLGILLANRVDPPRLDEARTWSTRAAEAGHTGAMLYLGALLAERLDPPRLDEARTWYVRAAEAGDSNAMFYLGELLAKRLDPPRLDEARTWYQRAADAGHAGARSALEVLGK
jgi:hypothetical protein